VGSVLRSVARTWKLSAPGASPVYPLGEPQAANAARSREHWKLEPASLAENLKAAPVLLVSAGGPKSIVV
jgi:hypothetical protein